MANADPRANQPRAPRGTAVLDDREMPRHDWHDLPALMDGVSQGAGPANVATGAFLGAIGGLFLGGVIAAVLGASLTVTLIGMAFGGVSAAAVGGMASGAARRPWE